MVHMNNQRGLSVKRSEKKSLTVENLHSSRIVYRETCGMEKKDPRIRSQN